MKFTLNRNLTLASTSGHAIVFVKDEPIFVPPPMYKEVKALGAIPQEDEPEVAVDTKDKTPQDPDERASQIKGAIEALTLRNRREDFTAGGAAHQKALAEYLGWTPTAKERDLVMAEMAKAE